MWGESRSWEAVRGLKLHELGLDEAFVNVSSRGLSRHLWLYSLRPDCQKCPYQLVGELPAQADRVLKLNSQFAWQFRVLADNLGHYVSAANRSSLMCEIEKPLHLGEFGVYDLEVRSQGQDDAVSCNFSTFLEPVNVYLPMVLITALTLLVVFGYVWVRRAQKQLARKYGHHTEIELQAGLNDDKNNGCDKNANNVKINHQRSLAIDTFRGGCMFVMVFYNHGQGGYAIFTHIAWDGLQLADIPFPWFIWIMGVCIPLSINSVLKKNISRLRIIKGIIKRSLLLFLVGLILTGYENGPELETFRVMHVLQRFGVLCLIAGSLCAALWPRNNNKVEGEMRDVRILAPQWAVHLIIQVVHLCLTFYLPVPGCPTGYLGPGGLHDNMKYANCTGGTAGYIDRLILPAENLFHHCTPKELYRTGNFEPEGIYTTLPTLLSVILGMQAGATLLAFDSIRSRVYRWCVWGISCLTLACLLSFTEIIPFNKNLWSTSFALVTSGLGFLALALCHVVVDGWRYWHGAPFIYYGRNALLVYGGTKLTGRLWPWYWQYGKMDTHTVLWLNTCWSAILWLYTVRELHRRKIFIKF